MLTLGLETSCDDTSCGIVDDKLNVLANEVYTQKDTNTLYQGVIPEVSSRAHLEKVAPIVDIALQKANLTLREIDLFSFTRGPGLVGALLVGANFIRGLGYYLNKPVEGVNHLEGHVATTYLANPSLKPPFLCLIVSGGHTEICLVEDNFSYTILGKTRDDAAGEAYDKCGKILGLGYPAGPVVSRLADDGGDDDFTLFPQGLNKKNELDFSFSGLKSAFLRYVKEQPADVIEKHKVDICASLQKSINSILIKKTIYAMKKIGCSIVTLCGGVSANANLQQKLTEAVESEGGQCIVPHRSFCADNGAMIAACAQIRANQNSLTKQMQVSPGLRW